MAAKKKLIIDGQIFQTAAKDRGMGRYSTRLIETFIEGQRYYSEVEIILTENLLTTEKIKRELKDIFVGAKLQVLNLWTTKNHTIEEAFIHNEAVLSAYVKLQTDKGYAVDFLVPSVFQEPVAAVFPSNARKLLIFYDLIPFLYHRRYKPVMNFDNYLKRFKYVFEADKIFTISQTVADDLSVHLGLPKNKLVRIDGAAIRTNRQPLKPPMAIADNFILMPTSDDPRKNNLRAVLGFEEFRHRITDAGYKLVITSKIHKREREYLQLFSKDLIFTGNLPEEQLEWLYGHCKAVLFVPEYEGLGLPVLEAVEFGKSVVCSRIGVFKEIAEDAFSYCDYENSSSIADALETALAAQLNRAVYNEVSVYYSWGKTLERFMHGIKTEEHTNAEPAIKPRIAVFTPQLDGASEVASTVVTSHAVLSEHFGIDYYIDESASEAATRPDLLRFIAPVHAAEAFGVKDYASYDAVIYHIGNGGDHLQTLKNALYLPGYVVLHNTGLTEAYQMLGKANLMSVERIELESKLDDTHITALLNRQLGILTHSKYAQAIAKNTLQSQISTLQTNLPTSAPALPSFKQTDRNVIGLAGLSGAKDDIEFIEEIANDPYFNNWLIWPLNLDAPPEIVDKLNAYENVSVKTNLTDFEFQSSLGKLSIFVDYHLKYNGETSLAALESMGHGAAVIVRDIGWYAELPGETITKVQNMAELIELLHTLTKNDSLHSKGSVAKAYVEKNCGHEQYALAMKELITQNSDDGVNHKLAQMLKSGHIKSTSQYVRFLKDNI